MEDKGIWQKMKELEIPYYKGIEFTYNDIDNYIDTHKDFTLFDFINWYYTQVSGLQVRIDNALRKQAKEYEKQNKN